MTDPTAAFAPVVRLAVSHGAVELSAPPDLPADHILRWEELRRLFVLVAWIDRPCTVVCTSLDSLPWLIKDHSARIVRQGKRDEIIVLDVGKLTLGLLNELIETMEFEIGMLWITSPPQDLPVLFRQRADIVSLLEGNAPNTVHMDQEVLVVGADGAWACWLRPDETRKRLLAVMTSVAHMLGWEVRRNES